MSTKRRNTIGLTLLATFLLAIPAASAQTVTTIGKEVKDVKLSTNGRNNFV